VKSIEKREYGSAPFSYAPLTPVPLTDVLLLKLKTTSKKEKKMKTTRRCRNWES
jgi:hypothetical protein